MAHEESSFPTPNSLLGVILFKSTNGCPPALHKCNSKQLVGNLVIGIPCTKGIDEKSNDPQELKKYTLDYTELSEWIVYLEYNFWGIQSTPFWTRKKSILSSSHPNAHPPMLALDEFSLVSSPRRDLSKIAKMLHLPLLFFFSLHRRTCSIHQLLYCIPRFWMLKS